jgi:hypothetical protein
MDERTVQAEIAAARQYELRRRRVKRGVIAGYLHEISARHREAAEAQHGVVAPSEG